MSQERDRSDISGRYSSPLTFMKMAIPSSSVTMATRDSSRYRSRVAVFSFSINGPRMRDFSE